MFQMYVIPVESAERSERIRTAVRQPYETHDQSEKWNLWIDRIGRGDTDALEALYDASSTRVFSLLMHMLPSRQTAEDALVEVYKQVGIRAQDCKRFAGSAFAWLIDLARSVAVSRLDRSSNPKSSAPASNTSAFETAEVRHNRRRLNLACDQLTEDQLRIIQMTYFGGLTAVDVAHRLGMPIEEVRRQIHTGMTILQKSLGGL